MPLPDTLQEGRVAQKKAPVQRFDIDALVSGTVDTTYEGRTFDNVLPAPGFYTISSSNANAMTILIPSASAYPGGEYMFRWASAHAHAIAGVSGELAWHSAIQTEASGTTFRMGANIGDSAFLRSDGRRWWIVQNHSGSLA